MRILLSFAGGSGHFIPLLPIARAAQAAGHSVVFACQPAMLATVAAAGFEAHATGGATLPDTPTRFPLLRVDMERENQAVREGYARRIAGERAAAMLALCQQWAPDLLVCDEMDFGSMVVAERLGLPYASVLVIAAGSLVRPELVAEPLDELRAAHGLPPDPQLEMLSRYLVLSPIPPGYRDPAFPAPATTHTIRPLDVQARGGDVPCWEGRLPDAPLVYLTLGTVFNIESGDLFPRLLGGVRDLPINVIATVGQEIDPRELGPQPANIRIARYIPQSSLLPHCDAVISHGGSGSVIGALAHGLPMVLLPMGADQPLNAARCVELGVARALDAVDATPDMVRDAIAAVLADRAYRQAAGRLQAAIAAQPGPEYAVELLERLAAEKRPLSLTGAR